ncbi:hypothetical protein PR202_gb04369 [Eleusine coracana subsp. coracana]|uniref:Uncharacterized protein n=1 Tax=Eleusine coracana subsp. coracana TaxID=191504 RepID=A0AAV5E3P8_ELECO|nr:hypothetical protein QOZ80_1BG0088280 [Eleusine coracana subsp. coracana]GJN17312.1 hypothetical protein PR202_gb04369 [Eleusine coracana subsp. coracana]
MPPAMPDHHQATSPRRGSILPQSPLRIKQDGKFYERLLTKEATSTGNLSFRYYWAEPGSVPFVWETQPGTPKDVAGMAAGALPPAITPPPAYMLRHNKVVATSSRHHQSKSKKKSRKGCRMKRIRIGFIAGFFRRLSLVKAWRRAASPVKASSSSRWLFCSVAAAETGRGKHDDHHENEAAAPARQQKIVTWCSVRARPKPWLPRFRGGLD